MNERIRELKQQATEYVDSVDTGLKLDHYQQFVDLKFAELVVQRTLEIVGAHTEIFQSDEARTIVEHIKRSVKTDFGVEQ